MLRLQIVPRSGVDAFRLLRDKVTFEAQTWAWRNKLKTRIGHIKRPKAGCYIKIEGAGGVVVADIRATSPDDTWFLSEKFIGRVVSWFGSDIAAINVQFSGEAQRSARNGRRN